jgi:hypothetical protein
VEHHKFSPFLRLVYQQWRLAFSKEEVEGGHLEEPQHHGVEIVGLDLPINQGAMVEREHQMIVSVHQLQYLVEVVEAVVVPLAMVTVVGFQVVLRHCKYKQVGKFSPWKTFAVMLTLAISKRLLTFY